MYGIGNLPSIDLHSIFEKSSADQYRVGTPAIDTLHSLHKYLFWYYISCIYKHFGLWVPYLILFILIFILLIREMEWRLDKEGREYHHYEDFCKLYRSEILNLNRMLDMLSKNGMLPGNLNLNFSVSNVSVFH